MTVYYRGQVVGNGGSSYVCILDHTSSASDEPGVGGSWTTYWAVVAAAGTGLTTGDKGDITVSGGGSTWTIDNDAVTYAKIQNVSATDRILGRSSAGAGDIEEITCTSAGRAILDDADAAAQRTTLGLGTLATQSGTFSGTSSGTNTGDQTITLTGDVTGSGTGSFAATVANDAVTYAKIQNVSAASRLLGRGDSGSGDVQEITLGSGLSMTGTTLAATGGGVTDGDKGDITVSASGATWTIDADAVTFAKLQNIATDRLVGRDTASSGDAEEITVGGGLEFTGSGGIQRSQLLGDVEAAAGSGTTTIATGAVTLAKMANLATDRLIGRDTAGTGAPEALTVGGGIEFTGSGGIQRSALSGDVTATAGSNILTIGALAVDTSRLADGAVTFAKLDPPSADNLIIGVGPAGTAWTELPCIEAAQNVIRGIGNSTDFANLNFKSAVNRNISEGTASPTGGADGDIYLQYV